MRTPSRALGTVLVVACLSTAVFAPSAGAATPAWVPLAASGPTVMPPHQNEVQRVGVDAELGTFTLSFGAGGAGVGTTTALSATATAEQVASALNALTNISAGSGSVTVVGGPGNKNGDNPYFVIFDGGSLALADVTQMSADSTGLEGGGNHTAVVTTTVPGGAGTTDIGIYAQNVGGVESLSGASATVKLPTGVTTTGVLNSAAGWSCPGLAPGQPEFTCIYSLKVGPGLPALPFTVEVTATPLATSGVVELEVSGGGATKAGKFEMPLAIGPVPAGPGIQSFTAGAYDEDGNLDTRAGAHPSNAATGIMVNSKRNLRGELIPAGEPKNIFADLPPGFLGNPVAVPTCSDSVDVRDECSSETVVGVVKPIIENLEGGIAGAERVHNIQAPFGYPVKAKFATGLGSVVINVIGELRSDEDYGASFGSPNTPQIVPVYGVFFDFWGAPAHPSHDAQRGGPGDPDDTAFTTLATDCAHEAVVPPEVTLRLTTWQEKLPGTEEDTSKVGVHAVTDCAGLKFKGGLAFQPREAAKADSPTPFSTDLSVPADGLTEPDLRTIPELKKTVVDFPEGVVFNPAAADGLGACSEAQVGLRGTNFSAPNRIRFDKSHVQCPDSSKIGTVEVKSALLEETLHGALYLAAQGDGNPFGSLFAVYLVIDNPERGIIIKLPGELQPNPVTGQVHAVFDDNPQLPFTTLKLNLKGGPRAPIATPRTCGDFTTKTEITPWSFPDSGPPTLIENSFAVGAGANGAPCAQTIGSLPFNLGFNADMLNPVAGAYSPFHVRITRPDGSQEIDTLELTMPEGFTASLKGIPYCPEAAIAAIAARSGKAEQASSVCPSASRLGSTMTGAGSGSSPLYSPGKLYLTGPYKGAALSVTAVTPAVAGPFDLGNVVVRSALRINRDTAQVTAATDPLPRFFEGVALRVRDVRIALDRENWALNPTSCAEKSVGAKVKGDGSAVTTLTNRFQVGGCENLGFQPKLTGKLTGGTARNAHPALRTVLTYPEGPGYSNIARAAVTLPHSAFLENAHIRTICTRAQFAAKQCPAGSVYGFARAFTPLLDQPLEGPVYLKSSSNKLPDLVAALRGPDSQPIEVDVTGRIDSIGGGIRTTFDVVPDAPVSKFVLSMQGGNKGLLVNSRNLCTHLSRMTARFTAHNGKRSNQRPVLRNDCAKRTR